MFIAPLPIYFLRVETEIELKLLNKDVLYLMLYGGYLDLYRYFFTVQNKLIVICAIRTHTSHSKLILIGGDNF